MTPAERRRLLLSAAESLATAGRAMDRVAGSLDGVVTVCVMEALGVSAGCAGGVEAVLRELAAEIAEPVDAIGLHPNDYAIFGIQRPVEAGTMPHEDGRYDGPPASANFDYGPEGGAP